MAWLTIEEVADRYRITPSAIQKQRLEDRPPGNLGKHRGKRVLWDAKVLDEYDGGEDGMTFEQALIVALGGIERAVKANTKAIRETARVRAYQPSEGFTISMGGEDE